jgi:hypothetical protein
VHELSPRNGNPSVNRRCNIPPVDIGVLSVALEIVGHCLPQNRKPILKRVFSSKHFSVKERNACVKVAIEAKSWAKVRTIIRGRERVLSGC